MDYFSLDTETTGLNSDYVLPIEFCVLFETPNNQKTYEEIPKFKRYIKWPYYPFELSALKINANVMRIISGEAGTEDQQHLVVDNTELVSQLCLFLESIGLKRESPKPSQPLGYFYLNVVGKNVYWDLEICEKLPGWLQNIKVRKRLGDPSTSYVDWYKDKTFPNLSVCKERANISDIEIAHDSDKDAWDVIQVLRGKYGESVIK